MVGQKRRERLKRLVVVVAFVEARSVEQRMKWNVLWFGYLTPWCGVCGQGSFEEILMTLRTCIHD